LPSVYARLFVARTAEGTEESFEEVAARLDTVWVDVTAERLVLLWRGVTRVHSPRLRDIAAICTTLDPLDAPGELAVHHAVFTEMREAETRSRDAQAAARRAEIDKARQEAEARIAEARAKTHRSARSPTAC